MPIDDLKKVLEEKDTQWMKGGRPVLADQMREMVALLEKVKLELQVEQAKKLKVLESLTRNQVSNDPRYRVRKNNGNER